MKKDYKMRKTFRLSVKVKNCDTEFKEGMEKGVLLYQDRTYNLDPEEYEKSTFLKHLTDQQDRLIKEAVEVEMKLILKDNLVECLNCGRHFESEEEVFCSSECADQYDEYEGSKYP